MWKPCCDCMSLWFNPSCPCVLFLLICVSFKNTFISFFFFIRAMEMWSNNRQKINHLRRPWSHPDPQRRYSTSHFLMFKITTVSVFMLTWTWVLWSLELLRVSCFFPVPYVFCYCSMWGVLCVQELNTPTRYSQRRTNAQTKDTEVQTQQSTIFLLASFHKLPGQNLPLSLQSAKETEQPEAAAVPKDDADFKQVFQLQPITPSSGLGHAQYIQCYPLSPHMCFVVG